MASLGTPGRPPSGLACRAAGFVTITRVGTYPVSIIDEAELLLDQSEETAGRESAGGVPRYSRRLSDKILIAFHHACDQADFDVAQQLLQVLEMMLTRRPQTPDGTRRRNMESLVAAHERLWHLRHPDDDDR